jgi:hypothetical protein
VDKDPEAGPDAAGICFAFTIQTCEESSLNLSCRQAGGHEGPMELAPACPSSSALVGCCKQPYVTPGYDWNPAEVCYYYQALGSLPATCADGGGAWSATP